MALSLLNMGKHSEIEVLSTDSNRRLANLSHMAWGLNS